MDIYFAVPIFFVIAFVFSMLGMGGSQLYIPILYWLGMDFKTQAIPLGMLLNVVNSGSAAITYGKAKLIDWKVALPFGLTMVVLAPVGTWVNVNLPTKPIIAAFAVFTAAAAILMLSGWKPKNTLITTQKGRLTLGLGAGSVLGFIAGLIGRGGGSFIVPILYIAGLEPKVAAATSALTVTFSGISSFTSHIATAAQPQWLLWLLCVIAVFLGSQAGSRLMAGKMKSRRIKLVFGVVLLGVAAILIIKDIILAK